MQPKEFKQMIQKAQFSGDNPMARFGHTITPILKDKVLLFGGAVGDSGKYVINNDTYICDFIHKKWKKLDNNKMAPTNRAAHSAICIQNHLYVFGGALGGGQLADNNLYQLDLASTDDNKAIWGIISCNGASPISRYGHVMTYMSPYLIIHGGNTGSEAVNDIWKIDIPGNWTWQNINTGIESPPPRVYHSACICKTGTASGMMVIFGGRGSDQVSLNDTWGLRKHRNGKLDWMKAPYRNNYKPAERYQHCSLFIGTLLLIIGGRNNQVGQSMSLDVFDTDSSDWYKLPSVGRFRHSVFQAQSNIYIQGGFDQQMPNIPTQTILRVDLNKVFSNYPPLYKGLAFELGRDIILHNSNRNSKSFRQSQEKIVKEYSSNYKPNVQKMDIEYNNTRHQKRRVKTTDKPIRLCPQAIVANFNDEAEVKKIHIDLLPTQQRRLIGYATLLTDIKPNLQKTYHYFKNNLLGKSSVFLNAPIPIDHLNRLTDAIEKIVETQPTLIRIRAPVKIFGDIHGQVNELNRFFQSFGYPCDEMNNSDIQFNNYLFLGDYIDRGSHSIETIVLLFTLKLKYPDNIILLRGSHEDISINKSMGFGDECINRLRQNINDYSSFFYRCNRIFDNLPLAALIQDSILCIHGGIGNTIQNINQIQLIKKPLKINHQPKNKNDKIIYDLLWSDLCNDNQDQNNILSINHDYFQMKMNYKFTNQRTILFCNNNDLITIVRSHQPFYEGINIKESIVTVFSSSDYGNYNNKASLICISKNLEITPMLLNPTNNKEKWLTAEEQNNNKNTMEEQLLRKLHYTPPKK